MKTIVLYKSNTGNTKAYAQMLAKNLLCEAVSIDSVRQNDLSDFDRIIFGGGVRASQINSTKKFLKMVAKFKDKEIIFFAVGANGKSDANTRELYEKNLACLGLNYPLFYLQGGFDPEKLNFALKAMLQRVAKSIEKKAANDPKSLTASDRDFLKFFNESHSEVSEENLTELINYLDQGVK